MTADDGGLFTEPKMERNDSTHGLIACTPVQQREIRIESVELFARDFVRASLYRKALQARTLPKPMTVNASAGRSSWNSCCSDASVNRQKSLSLPPSSNDRRLTEGTVHSSEPPDLRIRQACPSAARDS